MRRHFQLHFRIWIVLLVLGHAGASLAWSQPPARSLSPSLAGWEPEPSCERSDDLWVLGAVLAGTGGAALWDEDLRDVFQQEGNSLIHTVAQGFNLLGHPLSDLAMGGAFYAVGRFRGDDELAETGLLAAEAVLGAEALVLAVKVGAGRLRPGPENDASSFRPFSFDADYDSFPSGHTAGAFALASVLAQRSEAPWVPWAAYGFAGLVGAARLVEDDHWASDVLAGALIGEMVGRWSVRRGADKPWRVFFSLNGTEMESIYFGFRY